MNKLILILFCGMLLAALPVSAERPYKNGYLLRNAVVRDIHIWDKNWTLLGIMDASGGEVKIPDDAFPLIVASCAEPGKDHFNCVGGQHEIKTPGCWVLWYWPWGSYFYETIWACGVGSKAPITPAKSPSLKTDVKKAHK